jgi:hypothetical protein
MKAIEFLFVYFTLTIIWELSQISENIGFHVNIVALVVSLVAVTYAIFYENDKRQKK